MAYGTIDKRMFYPEPSLFSGGAVNEGLCTAQAGGGGHSAKFMDLEEGEKLNQSLVNKHFVFVVLWGKAIHLSVYEAKN